MRAQRRDENEADVIAALEDMGYIVTRHYTPDPFDIDIRRPNSPLCLRMEIKAKGGSLTDKQREELAEHGIVVAWNPFEACELAERYL